MPIEFQCPGCQKTLRTADDKAGRTARCPQCGKPVTVPSADEEDFENPPSPPPPESPWSDFEELTKAPPRQSRRSESITCPMCGHVNDETAERCLACGEPLEFIPAASRGRVSTKFGDIWDRAWKIWTANLGINIAAAAICAGISIGVSFVLGFVFQILIVAVAQGGAGQQEGAILLIGSQAIQNLISYLLSWYLMVGFAQFAIENVRRDNPELGSLFITGGRILPILGTMFCTAVIAMLFFVPGIALMVGGAIAAEGGANEQMFLIFLVAGFVVALLGMVFAWALFWPVPFMLADRSSRYFQSITDAPRMTTRFFGLSATLFPVYFGLYLAGLLACCVGLLFSIPLVAIVHAVAYDHCRITMESNNSQ